MRSDDFFHNRSAVTDPELLNSLDQDQTPHFVKPCRSGSKLMEKVITIWHSYATKSGFLATGPIYLTRIFLLKSLDLDKARLFSSLINLQTVWLSTSDTRIEQNQVFS